MSVSFLGARICRNRFRMSRTIQNAALGLVLCCLLITQSQASSGSWQSPADETMLDDVYIRSNNSLGSPTTPSVSGVHSAVTYRNLWRWFDLDTVNVLRASYVDSGYLALTLKSTSFIGDGEALVYSLRPLEKVFKEDSTDWYNANTKGDPNGTDSIAWNTAGGDYGVASDPGGERADSIKIYKSAGTVYQINQLGDTSVATVDDTVYFWFSSTWATESIDTSADLKFELVADRIDGNSTVRIDYHSSESGTASQRPYVKLFYHSNDIALIVADTNSLGADSILRDRIEDSLTTASGERFRVNILDDLDSHNQRTDTGYWADYLLAIWASGTFGSYHIADQPIPVMTFNRYHYNEYSLGSASKAATAAKLLLNLHSSWLTDRIPADTLYTIQGSNLAFGEIIGVSDTADDVKAVAFTLSSAGPDTSVMVVVDSAGHLYGAAGSAPNRRIFMGNMGAINLLTWAQGWEMFNRAFYYALADTTNVMVRQEINISDRWGSASTWFETGSCDNATISNSSTMRPGFDNGVHLGALLRYDSLTEIIGPAPPGSLTVIDSAKVSLYLTSSNAYNLDGTDSSFDYRLYVARVKRQVNWNEGASTYSGATCGVNDTASSSNHWANRLTPSYPGDSTSNWGDGSSLTDSSWEIVAARGVGTDIYSWFAADTVRCNKTTTLPGSWTRFPVQSSWFQDWYDGLGNSGFAIGQDTLYDSSSCELNYRSRKELPTTNNAPRLTIWWSYQAAPSEGTPVRRRVIQQVYGVSARLMQEWGFVYEGRGSWSAVMNTTALQLTIIDLLERYDIDENGRVNIGDIQALLNTLWSGSAVESFAIEEYQEGEIW